MGPLLWADSPFTLVEGVPHDDTCDSTRPSRLTASLGPKCCEAQLKCQLKNSFVDGTQRFRAVSPRETDTYIFFAILTPSQADRLQMARIDKIETDLKIPVPEPISLNGVSVGP